MTAATVADLHDELVRAVRGMPAAKYPTGDTCFVSVLGEPDAALATINRLKEALPGVHVYDLGTVPGDDGIESLRATMLITRPGPRSVPEGGGA